MTPSKTAVATRAPATVQAAGAVVWRMNGRKLEVLLVHRPKYDDWSWPKGKLDPGECVAECAVREVAEETGEHVVLGQPLPGLRYRLSDGRIKHTRYWAAQVVDPESAPLRARPPFARASTDEIDEVRWVEATKAREILTYPHDLDPLGAVLDQWRDERLRTWTLAVVRHAASKKRSAWKGSEATRPLTPAGELQAQRLAGMLAAFGVEEVLTSPWERCAATVRPYLEATGIGAELRPELTEDAHANHKKPVRDLVRRELGQRNVPVALCTHRPVLPTVVEEIARRTPHRIMKQVPESDPWLRKGEMLIVHVSQRPRRSSVVVALEKHRPQV